MTITTPMILAMLPLLITGATAILVMLSIAIRRQHDLNATLTVIGLNLALFSVPFAHAVGPQLITPLLQMDGHSIEEIGLRIGRTIAATKEYLSQCKKKIQPYIAHCTELLGT